MPEHLDPGSAWSLSKAVLQANREVVKMTRRIAAILLLQPKLDENYHKVKASAYDWPAGADVGGS